VLATSDSRDGNAVIGKKGTSVLDSGDIGEQSRQACTAPAEECQASAVHRGAAVTDLGRTCRCIVSVRLAREGGPSCNVVFLQRLSAAYIMSLGVLSYNLRTDAQKGWTEHCHAAQYNCKCQVIILNGVSASVT